MKKIVFIGAGSRSFGSATVVDAMLETELRGKGFTLTLVDENQPALDLMHQFALRVKEHTGSDVRLEATTDRRDALQDAEYVIVSVAQRRMELWEQDFRIPLAYGFRHCLGENGGPGALFHALRSLNLIMPICSDVEELCPNALLLNFTNPEARVLNAIRHLTRVKAVGLCHGLFAATRAISRYLGMPEDKLDIVSAGMNHLYCILQVKDRSTGEDLMPTLMSKVLEDDSGATPPLFKKMVEIFGVFSYPSDDHIGEYLSYGSEFQGVKWRYGQELRRLTPEIEETSEAIEDYAIGKRPLDADVMHPSGELAIDIICDTQFDRGSLRPAVNVLNSGGYVENLPHDAVVEVPAMVDASGIHPLQVGPIPEAFAAYIRTQLSIQKLLTEAWQTRSRRLLLQALLLDPNVNSITAADQMLNEMLDLQSAFLPTFI